MAHNNLIHIKRKPWKPVLHRQKENGSCVLMLIAGFPRNGWKLLQRLLKKKNRK